MKNSLKIFHSVLLVLLVFSANSCKKDKDDVPIVEVPKGTLSLIDGNVNGYQAVTLTVANIALDKSEYDLEVGSKKVKGLKTEDNKLLFMVPGDLPTGKYILKSNFGSNTLELNVTAPAPIADPGKTFADFVGNTASEVTAITALLGETTPPAYLVEAKQKIDDAMSKFNQLSSADKQLAAQILEANNKEFVNAKKLLEEHKTLLIDRTLRVGGSTPTVSGSCDAACYFANVIKLLGTGFLLTQSGVILPAIGAIVVVDILASLLTGERSFLLARIKAAVIVAFDYAYFPQIKYLGLIIEEGFKEKDINKGISTQTITGARILKGEPFNFQLKPVYRTFQRIDGLNKNLTFGSLLLEAYDKAKASYDKHFANEMGPFPGFTSKEVKLATTSLSDWEIKMTSNSAVTATNPSGTPANFNVTFNSTSPTEQGFEFDINYKGKYETISEHVVATLIPQREPNKIEISSGNNQYGESGKKLTDPLQVVVKDIKGKVLENVKVQWNVKSGGGTLSAAESLTDGKGTAKVEWTLGASGIQEVEAIAKRKDGTVVEGAPVLFKTGLSFIGKWKVNSVVYKTYDPSNGQLLTSLNDTEITFMEYLENNSVKIHYPPGTYLPNPDLGSFIHNKVANTLTISGTEENEYNSKFNIINQTGGRILLKTDYIPDAKNWLVIEIDISK